MQEFPFDIDKEIEFKRLKPEYLITLLENYFKTKDSEYPTSFSETIKYIKRSRRFFNMQRQHGRNIKQIHELFHKQNDLTSKIIEAVKRGEDVTKLRKRADKIDMKLSKVVKESISYEFDSKEFQQLVLIRQDFLYKSKLLEAAFGFLAKSSFLGTVTRSISLILSLLVSLYLDDKIESLFTNINLAIAKIVPVLLSFLFIDKIIENLENVLLWRRVKYLFKKAIAVELIAIEREYFNSNFNKDS